MIKHERFQKALIAYVKMARTIEMMIDLGSTDSISISKNFLGKKENA
jgi:hypothetical protein